MLTKSNKVESFVRAIWNGLFVKKSFQAVAQTLFVIDCDIQQGTKGAKVSEVLWLYTKPPYFK